jgi:transposase
MDTSFVGIDVCKNWLDVHVVPSGEAFTVSRDGKGLGVLIGRLRKLSPQLIAIEATGGFETTAAAALAAAELPLAIVNLARVRHFARAVGKRARIACENGLIAWPKRSLHKQNPLFYCHHAVPFQILKVATIFPKRL